MCLVAELTLFLKEEKWTSVSEYDYKDKVCTPFERSSTKSTVIPSKLLSFSRTWLKDRDCILFFSVYDSNSSQNLHIRSFLMEKARGCYVL